MAVKLGRVLRKGEYKVKIFELLLNSGKDEVSRTLGETKLAIVAR